MIARSRAIDYLRRRIPEPYDPAAIAEIAGPNPEDETEALLERWRIAGLLTSLPRRESELLVMRFYHGLTQGQIAEQTGIPLGTVKSRMITALGRLRDQLDHEDTAS